MPETIVLGSYEISHRGDATISDIITPRDWTIEGSNDGTTWTVFDTQRTQRIPHLRGMNSRRTYTVSGNIDQL